MASAPTFVAAGAAVNRAEGTGGNTAGVTVPAGIQANDILQVLVISRDNQTHSLPAGWTQKFQASNGASTQISLWWKRTTGSETAPVVTHSGTGAIVARMSAFRGVITSGDPYDAISSSVSATGTAVSTAAITTTTDKALLCHFFGAGTGNTANALSAASGCTTALYTASSSAANAGGRAQLGAYYQSGGVSPAGSSGSAGATMSVAPTTSTGYAAILVALIPDPSPPPAFVAAGTAGQPTAPSNPGVPAGLADGDVVVLMIVSRDNASSTHSLSANGTGWTKFAEAQGADNAGKFNHVSLWWKVRTGGSLTAPTIATTGLDDSASTMMFGFRNVDNTSPINVFGAGTILNPSTGTTFTAASITTTLSRCLLFAVGSSGTSTSFSGATGGTTTEAAQGGSGAGNLSSWQAVYDSNIAAGATTATTFNRFNTATANTNDVGIQFALAPSAYNDSRTEPASAADSLANAATFASSATEAASPADNVPTTATLNVPVSEPATAGDALGDSLSHAGGTTYNDPLSAAATAGDSETTSATFASPVPEAAAAAESVPTIAQMGNAVTEAAVAAAAVVGSGGIQPMRKLGAGRSTFGTGSFSRLYDGQYRNVFAWSATATSWSAIDLGTGLTSILVGISHEDTGTGDGDSGGMAAYRLQVSADSTNGSDGTWTTLVTVTGNSYIYREHILNFSGQKFLKLLTDSSTTIDELEIWDVSPAGVTDSWMFLGDSITNRATKRGSQSGVGQQPSFQADILSSRGQFPHQVGLGFVGQGVAFLDSNVNAYLTAFPDVKFVAVAIGTNDTAAGSGGLSSFTASLQSVVNKIKAAGRTPVIARIPWTSDTSFAGPGGFGSDFTALYNGAIDTLVTSNGLTPGPDLYTYSHTNAAVWFSTTDGGDPVHPGEEGCRRWNLLWSQAVLGLYPSAIEDIESASAADAVTPGVAIPVAATGAAAAADVVDGSTTISRPVAEPAAAADALGSSSTLANGLAEAAGATDAPVPGNVLAGVSATEPAAAADAVAGATTIGAAVAEPAAAADALGTTLAHGGGTVYDDVANEAASAAAGLSSIGNFVAPVAEGAAAAEAVAPNLSISAAPSEAAAAADATSATKGFTEAFTETSALADGVSSTANVSEAVLEAVAAAAGLSVAGDILTFGRYAIVGVGDTYALIGEFLVPTQQELRIPARDTAVVDLAFTFKGLPVDLTGASIEFAVRKNLSDTAPVLLKTSGDGSIIVATPATSGLATAVLDLSGLAAGSYYYDAVLVRGIPRSTFITGPLVLTEHASG